MSSRGTLVLATLVLLNVAFPLWRVCFQGSAFSVHTTADTQNYSYIGDDHPFYHPTLPLARGATLTLQETVHYAFNTTDDPDSAKEWDQILDSPDGTGRIHLGPMHRTFVLAFYHQLHCIVELKEALVDRNSTWASPHHVNHCLQYLRQTFLCQASDKLEEGDFMERNFATDRQGPDVECYDWEKVYQEVGARWQVFVEWKKTVMSN
ncbi:hypothetical protein D9619_010305 [Psilocybe cf. subviscida]|uniref:Oxidase ustYa n=1 Tax=Psilocybe cf. subviscida TaxID=2480587 RepID=A0A8H5ARY8_9AGAR|nr:hypothetical protein D9619_010305 [Psilocybe cf. subviscida]